jgi:hypothetical protein
MCWAPGRPFGREAFLFSMSQGRAGKPLRTEDSMTCILAYLLLARQHSHNANCHVMFWSMTWVRFNLTLSPGTPVTLRVCCALAHPISSLPAFCACEYHQHDGKNCKVSPKYVLGRALSTMIPCLHCLLNRFLQWAKCSVHPIVNPLP